MLNVYRFCRANDVLRQLDQFAPLATCALAQRLKRSRTGKMLLHHGDAHRQVDVALVVQRGLQLQA